MNPLDPLDSALQYSAPPDPSAALDARVLEVFRASQRPTLWSRLWSFHVTLPAPVLALVALLIAAGFWFTRRPIPTPPRATAPPAAEGYLTRLETAGFQPLPNGETRIVRSGAQQ